MKTLKLITTCILIFFAGNNCFAQISFKCEGKKYIIPEFRHDSIQKSYPQKDFEEMHILKPIKNSDCDIELRAYYHVLSILSGSAVVIKCKDNKLVANVYHYTYKNYNIKTINLPDTLLNFLITNKLFSLPNADVIRDSLENNHVKIKPTRAFDPFSIIFELKVKNNYRSFYCDPFMYGANQNIKDLLPEKILFDQIEDIYTKSGQDKNHLYP